MALPRASPWLLLLFACAAALTPKSMALPSSAAGPSGQPPRSQLTSAPTEPTVDPSRIGRADLEQAARLLSEARNELKPGQWKLLHDNLTQAQQAFERFNRVASASGKTAEVARGAEAGRAIRPSEGIEGASRAGPLLALLILLYPSSTAAPKDDHAPEWLGPQQEFEARLRELSQASQQVRSELEAERSARGFEAAKRKRGAPAPPRVLISDEGWKPAPGQPPDPPCFHKGTEGNGPYRPMNAPPDWMTCIYQCGKYEVWLFDVMGKSEFECQKPVLLERAAKEARRWSEKYDKGR